MEIHQVISLKISDVDQSSIFNLHVGYLIELASQRGSIGDLVKLLCVEEVEHHMEPEGTLDGNQIHATQWSHGEIYHYQDRDLLLVVDLILRLLPREIVIDLVVIQICVHDLCYVERIFPTHQSQQEEETLNLVG